jgi:hypothetical protein
MGKVKMLKEVSWPVLLAYCLSAEKTAVADVLGTQMTVAIGDEIRESSALAEKMNEGFDKTRLRLGRTMNKMLVMAERTGVGWRVWLAFFAAVIFLFIYVWLF